MGRHTVELGKTVVYSGDVQNIWEFVSKCDPDFSYFSTESETGVSVVKLDKTPGICSESLGRSALSFMWFVAFHIQTLSLWLQKSVFPSSLPVLGFFFCFCFQLLGNFPCQHGGVQLHSELQACGVTNKPLENRYFRQGNKCIFYVGFELF